MQKNVYDLEAINRAIARIIAAHNEAEVTAAKRENREPIELPHFSTYNLKHRGYSLKEILGNNLFYIQKNINLFSQNICS